MGGSPIKSAVASLDQACQWFTAICFVEVMQGGNGSTGGHFEHRAVARVDGAERGAAPGGGAVESTVAALHQACHRFTAIGATKAVQASENTSGGNLKCRADIRSAAPGGCAIESAIATLNQACLRRGSVCAIEAMEGGKDTAGGYLKYSAPGCAIESLLAALGQA